MNRLPVGPHELPQDEAIRRQLNQESTPEQDRSGLINALRAGLTCQALQLAPRRCPPLPDPSREADIGHGSPVEIKALSMIGFIEGRRVSGKRVTMTVNHRRSLFGAPDEGFLQD